MSKPSIDSLERVAGHVNLQLHRGSTLEPDILLARELANEGLLFSHLGECDLWDDRGTWSYSPLVGTFFLQYKSGRCSVVGG